MDLWRGHLTVRKAADLAAWLPPGAMVYVSEASDSAWTGPEWMLRHVAHALDLANWQRGGSRGTEPDAFDTPSEAAARATAAERKRRRAELAKERHMRRMSARHQAR